MIARRASLASVALVLLSVLASSPARAQSLDVRWGRDGAITGAAVIGASLASLIPVDTTRVWQRQLLPLDAGLEGKFSQRAAATSDTLAAVDVLTPLGLLVGQGNGFNAANDRRLLVYDEVLAVSIFLNSVTKYIVGRPRPYVYSDDPELKAYADSEGKDSHLSFYSGHASITFAASVAGTYLFAQASNDKATRAGVWGFELALATATARLRTRAGKHFYSDVIVGAIVGAGVGYLIPRLHGGPAYSPSGTEWVVIGAAPIAGLALGQLLPATPTVTRPLTPVALPFITPRGGGMMLAQSF
jgi:membrane-associated phospholipid phosphatase